MTIDTSSLTAAQARVAQIQSLFAAPTGPAAAPTSAASPTTGEFGDAMARAQGSTGKAAPPLPMASSASFPTIYHRSNWRAVLACWHSTCCRRRVNLLPSG